MILTASQAHEDLLRGELLRVEGYLVKPVDLDRFVQLVRQLKDYWHADVILPDVRPRKRGRVRQLTPTRSWRAVSS